MPCMLDCEEFPLTKQEVDTLWELVRNEKNLPDDTIAIRCVDTQEVRRLNALYRGKDTPTNVLTFSYEEDSEHDIALCMDVAIQEAKDRDMDIRDYCALLVVHALLHAGGMDHERSEQEAQHTEELERTILQQAGFVPKALSDVY